MTDAQLRKLAKQLRGGAEGYATLRRAFEKSVIGDSMAIQRARENMDRIGRELYDQADLAEDPPLWLREVEL